MTSTLPRNVLDKVDPDFHQMGFDVESYIKHELGIKLDKGLLRFLLRPAYYVTRLTKHPSDEQICQDNLSPEGCPLGPQKCPLRHTTPSATNFKPQPAQGRGDRQLTVSFCFQ